MKLSARDAISFFAKPDTKLAGILIHGADAMRIALKRQEMIAALVGPEGESEMRLSRLSAGELRRDKAMLADALKEKGFFPGHRVTFVEDATELAAPPILDALSDWQAGDAQLVVTAGSLKATSKLRKAFEAGRNTVAIAIYNDPPTRAEIDTELAKSGLTQIAPEAGRDIEALARVLDPGDFRQTLEKLALYKRGDPTAVTSADVQACAPVTTEAGVDDLLNAAAEGKEAAIGPLIQKIDGQGVSAVALSISMMRHFRTLHAAASDPGGVSSGIARARPPIFGPRRDRMSRQAQTWGVQKLETALGLITDTDLTLRSASRAPTMAVVERALIRLAMLSKRG
ncbi:DNA polymerase III subunit delta [Celeribacter arenosi]|uniref:DNA-directed DNA polymerase n=1 Tax=Celeribacter arenosi TaxID=792649 RepID=A0ABP7JWJ6_9RHOB